LQHLSGKDTPFLEGHHSLGEVNPHIVQGMATGLQPYMNNVAGLSGALPDFNDVGSHDPNVWLDGAGSVKDGSLPNAKALFSVLNGDPGAAKVFDGAAYQQMVQHDKNFAEHPGTAQPSDLYDAATLRGLVDVGTHNAFQAAKENDFAIAKDEYTLKKSAYDYGMDALGKVPGAGEALGKLGNALEGNILGPPPDSPPTDHLLPMMDPGTVENEILNGMIASGQPVHGIPDTTWYEPPDAENPFPRLRTPERMQELFGITPDKYNEVVGGALSNYLVQANYMESRYNSVTHETNPRKP
jgi:hypothetical protein